MGRLRFKGICTEAPDYKCPYLPGITQVYTCPKCAEISERDLSSAYLMNYMPYGKPIEIYVWCSECGHEERATVTVNMVVEVTVSDVKMEG